MNYQTPTPGSTGKMNTALKTLLITIGAVIALCFGSAIVAALVTGDDADPSTPNDPTTTATTTDKTTAPQDTDEKIESELTVAQEQAVGAAESYLEVLSFSRTGLVEQLEYEGFDTADAEFAVDHMDVDWNEQAVRSAENYLEFTNFSRQGLIDQLEYEGFTTEQAEYGADSMGL